MQMPKRLSSKAKAVMIEVRTNAAVKKSNINVEVIKRQNRKPIVAANFLGAKSVILGFRCKALARLIANNFSGLNLPEVKVLNPKSTVRNNTAQ